MNSIHDMGGMHGFGPIRPEKNEPVLHARWEGRILAIYSALGALGKWNIDFRRQTRESLPPAEYVTLTYYQLVYALVMELLAISGLATRAELEEGRPADSSQKAVPTLTAGAVAAWVASGSPKSRDAAAPPKFQAGQRVINPQTHTRLPRYARGKFGVIERDHGVFVFPDSNAQGLGEKPQHVYSVRFEARELCVPLHHGGH